MTDILATPKMISSNSSDKNESRKGHHHKRKAESSDVKRALKKPAEKIFSTHKPSVMTIQQSATPASTSTGELERLVHQNLGDISKNFLAWPLEKLRVATRSNLPDAVELLKLVRRTKEAQLVMNKYLADMLEIVRSNLNDSDSPYRIRHKAVKQDEIERLEISLLRFACNLNIKMFNDGREVDYPLNTKRTVHLGELERTFGRDSFKHRLLFESSERQLVLDYRGVPMFTLVCRDVKGEELNDYIRLWGGRLPSMLSSYISIYLHANPEVDGQDSKTKSLQGNEAKRDLLIYYCTPMEQYPRQMNHIQQKAMESIFVERLGTQMYHPTGNSSRISTEDIFSVLLDIAQLVLLDRNPNNGAMVWSKIRSLYSWEAPSAPPETNEGVLQDSTIDGSEKTAPSAPIQAVIPPASSSPQGPKSTRPSRFQLTTFISQSVLEYSTAQKYLYEMDMTNEKTVSQK